MSDDLSSGATAYGDQKHTFHCPECRRPLVNLVSGSTCPHGCKVGIFPKVPKIVNDLGSLQFADGQPRLLSGGLLPRPPRAAEGERFYTRDIYVACGQLWRRVVKTPVKDMPPEDRLIIGDRGEPVQVTPWDEGNQLLKSTVPVAVAWETPLAETLELMGLSPGKHCRLRSGGPVMEVVSAKVDGHGPLVLCRWDVEGIADESPAVRASMSWFGPAALVAINYRRPAASDRFSEAAAESGDAAGEAYIPEEAEAPEASPPDSTATAAPGFADLTLAERTGWWGVIRPGSEAPWETPVGLSVVTVHKARRAADGSAQFGVGDPDELVWVGLDAFATSWPAGYEGKL